MLGFAISQGLTAYGTISTLRTTKNIQMANLAHHLADDFAESKDFQEIRMRVERCEPLFNTWHWPAGSGPTKWDGKFDNDHMNRYLNFLDNIGFYADRKDLDDAITQQMFGAAIVEAYEEPEIRCYVNGFHTSAHQHNAFAHFENLALRLEDYEPDLAAFQNQQYKKICTFTCPP